VLGKQVVLVHGDGWAHRHCVGTADNATNNHTLAQFWPLFLRYQPTGHPPILIATGSNGSTHLHFVIPDMVLLEDIPQLSDAPQDSTSHRPRSDLLFQQVRIFLEGAEEIDIEAETMEDLYQTINQNVDPNPTDEELDAEEFATNTSEEELDVSALYSIEDEGGGSRHF
jgi:hypothetical protein